MEDAPQHTIEARIRKIVLWWVGTILLIIAVWIYFFWIIQTAMGTASIVVSFIVFYAVIIMVIDRSFSTFMHHNRLHYRWAYITTISLAFLQVIFFYWLTAESKFASPPFAEYSSPIIVLFLVSMWLFAAISAFFGALLITGIQEGLIEDNPPSPSLIADVHKRHVEIAGVPEGEPFTKRIFDNLSAALGFLVTFPLWLLFIFMIWFEDPGPVLFVKNSIGKGGKNFRQYKFRSMALEMEKSMALVQTQEVETKTLLIGRVLRKTALDELPQIINIMKGEMSLVGPRPHRTPLVALYIEQLPDFTERHMVLPGLAGLAQVSGDFYMTPHQKLRFDRLYIQYRSFSFDLKLLAMAFLVTFWYRWQKGWNGRLPRKYMHS